MKATTTESITAAEFGVAVAKAVKKNPDSRYWRLVEIALGEAGVDLNDVMEIRPLIERLAALEAGGKPHGN